MSEDDGGGQAECPEEEGRRGIGEPDGVEHRQQQGPQGIADALDPLAGVHHQPMAVEQVLRVPVGDVCVVHLTG
jgi:hypothetical protein